MVLDWAPYLTISIQDFSPYPTTMLERAFIGKLATILYFPGVCIIVVKKKSSFWKAFLEMAVTKNTAFWLSNRLEHLAGRAFGPGIPASIPLIN